MKLLLAGALLAALPVCSAYAEPCYNVDKGEPHELTGLLDYVIYPGPPNFSDVQKGDTPEPNYVLRLTKPICINEDQGFGDPRIAFRTVQIIGTKSTSAQLKLNVHKTVTLTLANQMAAETGHHHEPLVAWATALRAMGARPMDFVDEYGTPATTIRAFYAALRDGRGEVASSLIVPEKRHLPAFSPSGLTRFYGRLAEPIRLLGIDQSDQEHFVVRYRYSTKTRTCDAHAIVSTALRRGRNFIQSIQAINGC